MFDQPLLLDMIFLGTSQLRGGVNIFFLYKVSFEKHPSEQGEHLGPTEQEGDGDDEIGDEALEIVAL